MQITDGKVRSACSLAEPYEILSSDCPQSHTIKIEYGEDQQSLQPEPDIDRVLTVAPEKDAANAPDDMLAIL